MDIIQKLYGTLNLSDKIYICDATSNAIPDDCIELAESSLGEYRYDVYLGHKTDGRIAYITIVPEGQNPKQFFEFCLDIVVNTTGDICVFNEKRYFETRGETGAKTSWYNEAIYRQRQIPRLEGDEEGFILPLVNISCGTYKIIGNYVSDDSPLVTGFTIEFLHPDEYGYETLISLSPNEFVDEAMKKVPYIKEERRYNTLNASFQTALEASFQVLMEKIYYKKYNFDIPKDYKPDLALMIYNESVEEFKKRFPYNPEFFEMNEDGECPSDDFREEMINNFIETI